MTKSIKIGNHLVETCIATKDIKMKIDTRIQSIIKVKYNKPDVYIIDKIRKRIIVVKIVITRLDNLRTAK